MTHDVDEAFRLADRIVVMRAGRIEQAAPPFELFDQPATQYVRELVHAGDDVYRRYFARRSRTAENGDRMTYFAPSVHVVEHRRSRISSSSWSRLPSRCRRAYRSG